MSNIESYELGRGFAVQFDRSLALPPDVITEQQGKMVSRALEYQRAAEILYGEPGDYDRTRRVLDLGTGVGSFLVAAIAGHRSHDFKLECVGIDHDQALLQPVVTNLVAAMSTARELDPELQFSSKVLYGDWNNSSLWKDLGNFDWIFCNPPYLNPGDSLLPGYENVPESHVFSEDRESMYHSLLVHGLSHLNPFATMVLRRSTKDSDNGLERMSAALVDADTVTSDGFVVIDSWQPYSTDRSGLTLSVTKTDRNLPPHSDPRVMIYVDRGVDIASTKVW